MAIRAHQITLLDLFQDHFNSPAGYRRNSKFLVSSDVIEIHDVPWVLVSAIHARSLFLEIADMFSESFLVPLGTVSVVDSLAIFAKFRSSVKLRQFLLLLAPDAEFQSGPTWHRTRIALLKRQDSSHLSYRSAQYRLP